MNTEKKCIFIFRRDLRLTDNMALIKCSKVADRILPVFIYDKSQLESNHCSNNFLSLQQDALDDLETYLTAKNSRLCRFYGTPYKVLEYLIQQYKPQFVAFNLDYSYYSRQRDAKMLEICKKYNLETITCHDVLLCNQPLEFHKQYFRFAEEIAKHTIATSANNSHKYDKQFFNLEKKDFEIKRNKKIPVVATRKWALERVRNLCKNPESRETSLISAHLKLGLISCREVYKYAAHNQCGHLTRQLIWREFYFANWISRKTNHYDFYDDRFKLMSWLNKPEEMLAMWQGRTGYAILDASMNELNTTGFMWNRGRQLVGFFSVKILRINPFNPGRVGPETQVAEKVEKKQKNDKWLVGGQVYFSRMLIDCCYANNTGNWHWVASDELDTAGQRLGRGWSGRHYNVDLMKPAKQYRISDEEYIKKWLPNWQDYKSGKIKKIVNYNDRWNEWRELTQFM